MKQIIDFLKRQEPIERPLLLALSGGSDSLALFRALLEWGGPFAVAHFDHGWRESSAQEAQKLRTLVSKEGIPFFLGKGGPTERNREATAREQRYNFLLQLAHDQKFQAILLAHHADDQAETVIQRVAEGASHLGLGAMRPVSVRNGVEIWRPLLSLPRPKGEGFDDPSNRDERFLRARVRHTLLPELERQIGKGVRRNLCRLGERANEWCAYLDRRVASCEVVEGDLGDWLPLPDEPLEREHLIRRRLQRRGITLSFEEIEQLRAVRKGEWTVAIDRDRLFFLNERKFERVTWRIEEGGEVTDWRGLFTGRLGAVVSSFDESRLRSRLSKCKVPHILWDRVPLFRSEGEAVAEFLTGRGQGEQTISLFPHVEI